MTAAMTAAPSDLIGAEAHSPLAGSPLAVLAPGARVPTGRVICRRSIRPITM